jgi:glycosyltransferase involved in cell wall biosynthesis
MPVLVRRARRIVTVSAFSCAELVELAGADPARVEVIPGGVDARFRPDADPEPARAALGLTRPYVLCVASHSAQKNLAVLVPVAATLNLEVVVAGGRRPQFAAVAGLEGLRLLGHVDDALLPGLRGGGGVRAAVALRGLRAAAAGGDGVGHAGRRHDRRRAAGDGGRRRAARGRPGRAAGRDR